MGLFGSGQLRRQIQELADEMETIRRDLIASKSENGELKKQLADKEDALKGSKESKKKLEKKIEKASAARIASEKKSTDQAGRIDTLEEEVRDYRKQLLKARDEVDRLHGKAAKGEPIIETPSSDTAEAPSEAAPVREFTPDPEREARRVDRRVERLEEKLEQEKSGRSELKDRLTRAEQNARDADRRRISELNKAEAVVRDLQHSLRSERRAYKILQLQYEAQLERAKAAEAVVTNAPAAIQPEPAVDDSADASPDPIVESVEAPAAEPAVEDTSEATTAEDVAVEEAVSTASDTDAADTTVTTEAPVDAAEPTESAKS